MNGFVQAMVIFYDVIGEVLEEFLCNLADRLERNHVIQRPVDNDRWNGNRLEVQVGTEWRTQKSRGEQDQLPHLSWMFAGVNGPHEPAKGGTDESPVALVPKNGEELSHPLLKGTLEVGGEDAGKPFTELARFAAVAVALKPVKVDEAACIHALLVRMFLHLKNDDLCQCPNHKDARAGKCLGCAMQW